MVGTQYTDEYSQQFIDLAIEHSGDDSQWLCGDLGTAYGMVPKKIIEGTAGGKGNVKIVAQDLSESHLLLFEQELESEFIDQMDRVVNIVGDLPHGVEFPEETFDALLCCRVFHFFDGETVICALEKFKKWLKPNGELFVVVESPYIRNFKDLIPQFEQRLADGVEFPGIVITEEADTERAKQLPPFMHFFTPETLENLATRVGFEIVESGFISREKFPEDLRLDGRESSGIRLRKPLELK
eukprot:TRINITY_DN1660_c0_g1_i2.p1 TRINITY_DN1660_c0_g1~~TRINITY_DN1660_c0_g1_i2.p1  ORF type:complete len:241 (-),score=85.49 TRINITY_DN1660_c0_g1_i2:896-1618(-)